MKGQVSDVYALVLHFSTIRLLMEYIPNGAYVHHVDVKYAFCIVA